MWLFCFLQINSLIALSISRFVVRQEKGFGGLLRAVGRRRGEAVPAALPQEVQPPLTTDPRTRNWGFWRKYCGLRLQWHPPRGLAAKVSLLTDCYSQLDKGAENRHSNRRCHYNRRPLYITLSTFCLAKFPQKCTFAVGCQGEENRGPYTHYVL